MDEPLAILGVRANQVIDFKRWSELVMLENIQTLILSIEFYNPGNSKRPMRDENTTELVGEGATPIGTYKI